ncbi:MAG: preprotein translocase subunit SecG [Desulfococcaceae bacterium]
MTALLITLHIIVCIALIMIVLLQTGKGADMGAAFGGGGSQTLFGSTGASTFLSRATTWAAVIFMLTCLTLAYVSSHKSGSSIMKDAEIPAAEPAATAVPENTADKKTEAETSSPLQTSVETKAVGEKGTADTKEVSAEAAAPAPAEAVQESPGDGAAPAVTPPVSEEGKAAEQGKSD